MAEVVVSFLLQNLKEYLVSEATVYDDVRRNINELTEDLEFIQSLLGALDATKVKGETIRHWVKEIKTLSYEMEDVLEFYNIKVESRSGLGFRLTVRRLATFPAYYLTVNEVKSQIDTVRLRFIDLFEGLERYDVLPDPDEVPDLRRLALVRNRSSREMESPSYKLPDLKSLQGEGIRQTLRRWAGSLGFKFTGRQVERQLDSSITQRRTELFEHEQIYGAPSTLAVQDPRPHVSSEFGRNHWLKQIDVPVSLDNFVGMENDIEALVPHLANETGSYYQVICLFGMRGSGKTALAIKLFNHDHVKDRFGERRAWVHLTQTFQISDVLRDILQKLLPEIPIEKTAQMEEIELAQGFQKVLQDKKCLVVLDDVRSSDAWEMLRIAFPSAETTSKIMLTTPVREVGETVAEFGYIHTMKTVSEEEGWKLFERKAFSTAAPDFQIYGMKKVIGMGLVRRCRGIPLAINMLGAFMESKQTLDEWETVYKDIDSPFKIGETTAIPRVLASSLIYLPNDLRQCYFYLGYFPEESEIEAEKLYLLWMAAGIIASQDRGRERSMMDRAEVNLEKLHQIGLVEVQEELTSLSKFKSCRINWLMRELCLSTAKEEEFVEIIDFGRGKHGTADSFSIDSTEPLRGLVIYLDKYKEGCSVPFMQEIAEYLRILLCYNARQDQKPVPPEVISILSDFRVLRVLDFGGVDFEGMRNNLSRKISRLALLRYLSFKGCFLRVLPKALDRLLYLQTLDLRVRNEMKIPNVLWKIKRLRHLYLPKKFQTLDSGRLRLDSLTKLETLKHFNTKMCYVKHLEELTNLRNLAANTEGSVNDLEGLIGRMDTNKYPMFYSSLDVRNFDCYTEERHSVFRQLLQCKPLRSLTIEGQIWRIPSVNKISENLREIIISGSGLTEDPMLTFGELQNLVVLVMKDDAFRGENMVCTASGFLELKRLEMSNLCSLKKWSIQDGALAKLATLTIESCRRLETVPHKLEFVTNLAKLNIRKMPQTFEKTIREWKKETDHKVCISYEKNS